LVANRADWRAGRDCRLMHGRELNLGDADRKSSKYRTIACLDTPRNSAASVTNLTRCSVPPASDQMPVWLVVPTPGPVRKRWNAVPALLSKGSRKYSLCSRSSRG
jgi:hypothetical protein